MESKFEKLLALSIVLVNFFAFSGLLYRSQIYKQIPVLPGDAYGLGDIIDLLFAVVVIGVWCVAFISVVVLSLINFKNNYLASIKLLLYASVSLIGYFYIKSSV